MTDLQKQQSEQKNNDDKYGSDHDGDGGEDNDCDGGDGDSCGNGDNTMIEYAQTRQLEESFQVPSAKHKIAGGGVHVIPWNLSAHLDSPRR